MGFKFAGDKTLKQSLKTVFEIMITTHLTDHKTKHYTTSKKETVSKL